jgi:hypothetical protein
MALFVPILYSSVFVDCQRGRYSPTVAREFYQANFGPEAGIVAAGARIVSLAVVPLAVVPLAVVWLAHELLSSSAPFFTHDFSSQGELS